MGVIMQAGHHNKRPRSVILWFELWYPAVALQRPQYSRAQQTLRPMWHRGVQSFEVIAQSAPLIAHNSHCQRSFINWNCLINIPTDSRWADSLTLHLYKTCKGCKFPFKNFSSTSNDFSCSSCNFRFNPSILQKLQQKKPVEKKIRYKIKIEQSIKLLAYQCEF